MHLADDVAVLDQPGAQPGPDRQQRPCATSTVGSRGRRVVVADQQPSGLEHGSDRRRARRELAVAEPAPGVLGALAGDHQAAQQPPAGVALDVVEGRPHRLGPAGDRGGEPAHRR